MPPQLLTLSTPLLRTRTLQHTTEDRAGWDTVVTSLAEYDRLDKARIVGITLLEATLEDLPRLYAAAREVALILISEAIWRLKPAAYWEENFDNLLVLEQVHESYPFVGRWNGGKRDGELGALQIFAHLFRYHRLVTPLAQKKMVLPIGLTVEPTCSAPSIWLITQYFRATGSPDRQAEIRACLRANLVCPEIERVVLLNEQDFSKEWRGMPEKDKIVQVVTKKRLTYAHVLQFIHDEVPPNVIVVLANADIFFGSLQTLHELDLTDKALALLRWDVKGADADAQEGAVLFGPRADSQDAWVLLSDSVRARTLPYAQFDFPLGKAGCDNAFAAHLLRQRFSLFNPALTLRSYHLHESGVRTYSKADAIRSDLYVNLVPTHLLGTRQAHTPLGWTGTTVSHICHELVSFEVKSSSLSNEMTYCAMLEKEGRYRWEATVENYFFEPAVPVYHIRGGCGVTLNGMMFRPYEIMTGKDEKYAGWWEGSTLDTMTPLVGVHRMLALPFEDTSIFEDYERYVVEYLAWVARLSKEYDGLGFWVPAAFWNRVSSLPLHAVMVPASDACWADEVIGLLPGLHEVGHEEIQALREWHPRWLRDREGLKKCVVRGTEGFTARVQQWLGPEWTVGEEWEGAAMAIVMGTQPLWRLPVDALVIEFQQELSLRGEMQHLAHVSDLRSWVLLLAKGNDVEDQMIEQLEKWGKRNASFLL